MAKEEIVHVKTNHLHEVVFKLFTIHPRLSILQLNIPSII